MPEIANDPFCPLVLAVFPALGSRTVNDLHLISSRRVRERHQSILWIVLLLLGLLQRKQRGLQLLFRCSGFEESRNSAASSNYAAVFSLE
jgi:hypothetical protein